MRSLEQANSEAESKSVFARVWRGGEKGELLFNGIEVLVREDEKDQEMDGGNSCTTN